MSRVVIYTLAIKKLWCKEAQVWSIGFDETFEFQSKHKVHTVNIFIKIVIEAFRTRLR